MNKTCRTCGWREKDVEFWATLWGGKSGKCGVCEEPHMSKLLSNYGRVVLDKAAWCKRWLSPEDVTLAKDENQKEQLRAKITRLEKELAQAKDTLALLG